MIDERELAEMRAEIESLNAQVVHLLTQLENARHERDQLHEGITDVNELLGHEGRDVDDLRDAVGQIERLLQGKDLDDKLAGLADKLRLRLRQPVGEHPLTPYGRGN